jgi:hypothetical protein
MPKTAPFYSIKEKRYHDNSRAQDASDYVELLLLLGFNLRMASTFASGIHFVLHTGFMQPGIEAAPQRK